MSVDDSADTDVEGADTIIRPRVDRDRADSPRAPSAVPLRSDLYADTIIRPSPRRIGATHESPVTAVGGPAEHGPSLATGVSPYRVSINGGSPMVLDVPHLVGRNPRTPRVTSGAVPRLVAVPSPRGEVSATHVEICQVGRSIVITDLRSTNGTVVAMPGSMPLTMRAGESLVVGPGTVVEIGDGNSCEILPPPRLHPAITPDSEFAR